MTSTKKERLKTANLAYDFLFNMFGSKLINVLTK